MSGQPRVLTGRVVSGKGDFGRWIAALHEHYRRKTGMDLYPGTLNVLLAEPYTLPPNALRLEASEYGGSVSVAIQPCRVFGRRAFILRTDANAQGRGDHPPRLIEIACDVKLRDVFGLEDGAWVTVEVS